MLACAQGTHYPKAILYCRKAGGNQPDFYVITLEDVLVSSFTQGGGGDRPTESLSLNFTKIEWNYMYQDARGVVQSVKTAWDLLANPTGTP